MNSQNKMPGIAALALALLFPIYWGSALYWSSFSGDVFEFLKTDMQTFTAYDVLFLVIGVLEIYVYLSLAKALKEQLNSSSISLFLMIMAFTSALFHATVFIDVWLSLVSISASAVEDIVSISLFVSVAALVISTLAALICSILLLMKHSFINGTLKVFSILLLIVSFFQITVLFSAVNLLLFPCTLILLAMYFFKDPESLEVI